MKTFADLHRAWWNYDENLGIAKIHHPEWGVLAFLFENNTPIHNVDFTSGDEIKYYRQQYGRRAKTLTIGVQIDRDVNKVMVIQDSESIAIPDVPLQGESKLFKVTELNLEIWLQGAFRYFRASGGEWKLIEAPTIEYQACKSLICIN